MSSPSLTPGSPPSVSLAKAATICGVSKPTIRRREQALREYGATITAEGWSIPIPALVAVGLLDRATPPEGDASPSTTPPEIDRLREEIAGLRERVARAEALAGERERTIEALNRALGVLEARQEHRELLPARADLPTPAPVQPSAQGDSPRRRWWRRGA